MQNEKTQFQKVSELLLSLAAFLLVLGVCGVPSFIILKILLSVK